MDDLDEDDLNNPLFNPSVEQIRRDVLEARADITAGRVVEGEVVLAKLKSIIDDYERARMPEMAFLSDRADRQAVRLAWHYVAKDRIDAVKRLRAAVSEALFTADQEDLPTKPFPSVYRELSQLGFGWFKIHRYWFAVEATQAGNVIAHIVHDQSDIPSRVNARED